MPPKKSTPKPFSDFSLLTPEEQESIKAEASAKVQEEAAQAARTAFLEMQIAEERKKHRLAPADEEIVAVTIDLPGFAQSIVLDGVRYMHGSICHVTRPVERTLREIMSRAWDHENEIGGANRDQYRAPRHTRLNGRTGAVTHG